MSRFVDSIEMSKNEQAPYRLVWQLCARFLAGKQTYTANRDTNTLALRAQIGGTSASDYAVTNLLIGPYRYLISALATAYPWPAVTPVTASPDDVQKAKASETALQWFWQAAGMDNEYSKLVCALVSLGHAGLHVYYDETEKRTGGIRCEHVSPFDMFYEPGCLNPEDSSWIAVRRWTTKEEIKASFPDMAAAIDAAEEVVPLQETAAPLGTINLRRAVPVFRVYYKDGRHEIYAKTTLLWSRNEFDFGPWKIPVVSIRYTAITDRLWGYGAIEPALALQDLYNRERNAVHMATQKMAQPTWLIPTTANVGKEAFTGKPGEKIVYSPVGGAPHQSQPAPLPGYVFDSMARLTAEVNEVVGVNPSMRGARSVGIESGAAIESLSAQGRSHLEKTQMDLSIGTARVCEAILVLMRRYSRDRMITIFDSKVGSFVHDELRRTNIVDDPEVFIEASALFRNQAVDRDQKILDLAREGFIDKSVALDALTSRTGLLPMTEQQAEAAHAREIVGALLNGERVEIFQWDDLDAFAKAFKDATRSEQFRSAPDEIRASVVDWYNRVMGWKMAGAGAAPAQAPSPAPRGAPQPAVPDGAMAGPDGPEVGMNLDDLPEAQAALENDGYAQPAMDGRMPVA